ncbi:signal peptidase I [[Clostridium] polysaccharolyticum]|uniref:Signal peptidase I n=1 Tax=[Clostridium] polysaccharolyticum TaxID=29364 RepID=A0A1H9Y1I0_9FIRM|nr:signal peptidase I [[Clostridium] polysaccharolyticum]SES62107.1 signal peptidase I [[Clostridium] polysaccharolyticum]
MDSEEQKAGESVSAIDRKKKIKGYILEGLFYAALFFICAFVLPTYVVQRAKVSGPSMKNTLQDEENVLVSKISYEIHSPERFDVVVFYPYKGREEYKNDKEKLKEHYVKRVIGMPGETIQIKGSDIYVNGEILEEHFGKDPIVYAGIAEEPVTLGKDEYFLMGDNRTESFDCRYAEIGPIHKNAIDGKVVLRIWPLKKFGTID